MIVFPNCKINIGLNVTGRRPDGYHDLQTIFYPIQINDILEITENIGQPFSFTCTGINTIEPANNLCVTSYELLRSHYQLPAINMHLHKVIPVGAGLGGGSADAVFSLLLLNKKFNLDIPASSLMEFALRLGSDCPFFIKNKPSYATGRGEILQEVELDLSAFNILIVNPGIAISTKEAFSEVDIRPSEDLAELIQQPVSLWKQHISNIFEKRAVSKHPEIGEIINHLYDNGALFASMSGTGSTVFGIFGERQKNISFPAGYFCKWV